MATRYKPQEIELLCREYNGYNIPSLAKALRRSESSVNNKLIRLGLHQTKCQDRPYKAQEERYLLKNFDGSNFKELAQTLLRSGYSVRSAVARLYKEVNRPEVRTSIRRMFQNGRLLEEIAEAYQFHPHIVRQLMAGRKTVGGTLVCRIDRNRYRREMTDTTLMQVCICDLEGIGYRQIGRLYGINPLCVPRMLRDMRQNGMYRGYIERFRSFNPTLYRRALEKGAAHTGNRGTRQ